MSRILALLAILLAVLSGLAETNRCLRTAAELREILTENKRIHVPFALEGVIERPPNSRYASFSIFDPTGFIIAYRGSLVANRTLQAGDHVILAGETTYYNELKQRIYARCDKLEVLAHGTPPPVAEVRCADLSDGKHDFRTIRVKGLVRNAFRDEIDPCYSVLILCDGDATLPVLVRTGRNPSDLDSYIGAEVSVTGFCNTLNTGERLYLGRILWIPSLDSVAILQNPRTDVFDVPDLSVFHGKSARDIVTSGRHKTRGHVITRWDGGQQAILETDEGKFVTLELKNGPSPDIGQSVEVSGMPETDLFRINLSRTTWRPAPPAAIRDRNPLPMTIPDLLADASGQAQIKTRCHGQTLRVRGTVSSLFESQTGEVRLVLEEAGYTLPVDVSACDRVPDIGARLLVTGVCVIESDRQRTSAIFPRVRGVFLVVNGSDDIAVLSSAPFWTPTRLLTVISTLAAVLVAILLWNLSLRTLIRRKTNELEHEIAKGLEAELRIHERTRLATELHDSVSQNLTGVALALDEVRDVLPSNSPNAQNRLEIAARTLKSCRSELRNCLWDLRSEALEEPEIDSAIRRTLAPHVRDANLAIRFRAPREAFTDNTLHTILCIIRELTVNALRHGGAKNVKIAGSLEDGELRFSVADDGCGFDPAARPNIDSGHFGLQGVLERAEGLGGTMTIRSQTDKGTKVTVSVKVKSTVPNA